MRRLSIAGAAFAALALLSGCSDPPGTIRAAEALGLRDVRPEGWALFGCGQDDLYHTRFTATAPNGRRVSGVACGGFLKGTTIRLD